MKLLRPGAILLVLCIYALTMAPSVAEHDAGELTTAAWTLGVGHPPGTPLYMLVLKGFLLIVPYGSIALRANLFSAAAALLAFCLTMMLLDRVGACRVISTATGLCMALSPVIWSQAVMAEVYTFEALAILAFFLALSVARRPETPAAAWGGVLAIHAAPALLTPLIIPLCLMGRMGGRRRFEAIVTTLAAAALPLALYGYLPLRSTMEPAVDWGNPETPQCLWWHLTNAQVRGRMLTLESSDYLLRAVETAGVLWRNLQLFLPLGLIGAIGGGRDLRQLRFAAAGLIAADAAFIIFADTAPIPSEAYGVPSIVACALLAGLALTRAGRRFSWMRVGRWVVLAVTVIAPLIRLPGMDRHDSYAVRDMAEEILMQAPPHARILTWEDSTTAPLAYLVNVERARSDLVIRDRQGNLFPHLYQRPLFLEPPASLPRVRSQREQPFVTGALRHGRRVIFTDPFLEYHPRGFVVEPVGTVGYALFPGSLPPETPSLPEPRWGRGVTWMERQLDAARCVRLAAGRAGETARRAWLRRAVERADMRPLLLRIAQLAMTVEEDALARSALMKVENMGGASAVAESLLGRLALRAGRIQGAQDHLDRALRIDPDLPHAHAGYAALAWERGDARAAERELTRALKLDPDLPMVLLQRCRLYLLQGRVREAESDARRALALDPGLLAARTAVIRCLLDRGDREEALRFTCGQAYGRVADSDLKAFLLMAARIGFPDCLDPWIDGNGGSDEIVHAYKEARDSVRRRGAGGPMHSTTRD